MENTSDSLMPRPLLLCLKSEKIVCYSVPDNSHIYILILFPMLQEVSEDLIQEYL